MKSTCAIWKGIEDMNNNRKYMNNGVVIEVYTHTSNILVLKRIYTISDTFRKRS